MMSGCVISSITSIGTLSSNSHGPKGRELIEDLVMDSPQARERALRAACRSIKARVALWNGTLSKLCNSHGLERAIKPRAA
jgi:hypothetical protein